MKTIWKYPLDVVDAQKVNMPVGSVILSVQLQHGVPTIWAVVSKDQPNKEDRHIRMFGTGHDLPDGSMDFIGTVQMYSGNLVFHVFEEKVPTMKDAAC